MQVVPVSKNLDRSQVSFGSGNILERWVSTTEKSPVDYASKMMKLLHTSCLNVQFQEEGELRFLELRITRKQISTLDSSCWTSLKLRRTEIAENSYGDVFQADMEGFSDFSLDGDVRMEAGTTISTVTRTELAFPRNIYYLFK